MSGVEVTEVEVHADDRGFVFEAVEAEEIPGFRNVHAAMTEPGEVRGNHVHCEKDEVINVQGPALVRWRTDGGTVDHRVPDGAVHRFRFPADVPHAVRHEGEEPRLLVALATEPHDPENPDAERVELIAEG